MSPAARSQARSTAGGLSNAKPRKHTAIRRSGDVAAACFSDSGPEICKKIPRWKERRLRPLNRMFWSDSHAAGMACRKNAARTCQSDGCTLRASLVGNYWKEPPTNSASPKSRPFPNQQQKQLRFSEPCTRSFTSI